MASKLPWFPFYALDWISDNRVLSLNNEQRGVYLWLLCRQWIDGSLPFELMHIYPLLPPGSDSAAVGFVVQSFFPPDPDTNERRNPRLAQIAEDQGQMMEANRLRTLKARQVKASLSVTTPVTETKTEPKTKTEEAVRDPRIPESLWNIGLPYFQDLSTRRARVGEVQMLLAGMRGSKVTLRAVERGVGDMLVAGAKFTPIALKRFAERAMGIVEQEDAQGAVQSHLHANQTPPETPRRAGWSEDELE